MVAFDPRSGVVAQARWVPSPNFDARPEGAVVDAVVLHCISLPPGQFGGGEVEALFTNTLDCDAHPYFAALRGLEVSAHFFIRRDGSLLQFVDCDDRAWHAGQSQHCGRTRCNDFSIGVELEGTEQQPFEAPQYAVLEELLAAIRARYPATRQGALVAHSDIAPGRKTDPGPFFDWARLRQGLRRAQSRPALERAA